MKLLLVFISFLMLRSPDAELLSLRHYLYASENSPVMAQAFYSATKKITEKSPAVVRGYKAMSAFMMCKHVGSPWSKLAYFNEGKKVLETAVQSDPSNVELRFLRYSTQINTPPILGYSGDLHGDKKILMQYLETENGKNDADLHHKISTFILTNTKPKN